MKTFDQLTYDQKLIAVAHAEATLETLIQEGFLDFGNGDGLTKENIRYYAQAAAEGYYYSESGDSVIDGIVE